VADIAIMEETGFGLATILPVKGALGPAMPEGVAMLGIGPDAWLGFAPTGGPGWAQDLAARLSGQAYVVDQSGGYRLFVLTGADAGRLLQKGLPVDLDPSVFPPGAVIVSAIAHIGATLRHVEPGLYHLFVPRSMGGSLLHWLETTSKAMP
jgi:methylglutamate dehydrogenase subunit D